MVYIVIVAVGLLVAMQAGSNATLQKSLSIPCSPPSSASAAAW